MAVYFKNHLGVIKEVGAYTTLPSIASQEIFTGATVPLTYTNNIHAHENEYQYNSSNYNITIAGLEGRATITGNGTKNVLVSFDVSPKGKIWVDSTQGAWNAAPLKRTVYSSVASNDVSFLENSYPAANESAGTCGVVINYNFENAYYSLEGGDSLSPLKNFTITCTNDVETLVYNGLHAHYNSTPTGILTLAFNTSTKDGTEGLVGTNYKFIETTTLPYFSSITTLWNTIYSYQVLNVLISNYSSTSIAASFLSNCFSFNQPLIIPYTVKTIGNDFLRYAYSFNQPVIIPEGAISIGNYFLNSCNSFNQELILPNSITTIGTYFLSSCSSFNKPLTLPSSLLTIGTYFLSANTLFNRQLILPNLLTSFGNYFLSGCHSFNQPLTIPSGVTEIKGSFLVNCKSYNSRLTILGNVLTIDASFLNGCTAFNQPLIIPNTVQTIGLNFMNGCISFNQRLNIPESVVTLNGFLYGCVSFNQPVIIPSSVLTIGTNFLTGCKSFKQVLTIPSTVNSIGDSFLWNCDSLSAIIYNSSALPPATYALAQSANSKPSTNGTGIIVYGTKRVELMTALPNSTSGAPYRRLVDGGS